MTQRHPQLPPGPPPQPDQDVIPLTNFPALQDAGSKQGLTAEKIHALISWAEDHKLSAWEGHAVYMFGKPYVTLAGRLYLAAQNPRYRGCSLSHVDPTEKQAMGWERHDVVWQCYLTVEGLELPVHTYGVVSRKERELLEDQIRRNVAQDDRWGKASEEAQAREVMRRTFTVPVLRDPPGMAGKRAWAKALERAFPLGLPVAEEAEKEEKP